MIVVDSSVAFKWLVPEDDSALAERLIGQPMIAPDLILLECGNAIWKRVRRSSAARESLVANTDLVVALVNIVATGPLVDRALAIAMAIDHSIYDCTFLALAEEHGVPLITADTKLAAKCATAKIELRVIALADWVEQIGEVGDDDDG